MEYATAGSPSTKRAVSAAPRQLDCDCGWYSAMGIAGCEANTQGGKTLNATDYVAADTTPPAAGLMNWVRGNIIVAATLRSCAPRALPRHDRGHRRPARPPAPRRRGHRSRARPRPLGRPRLAGDPRPSPPTLLERLRPPILGWKTGDVAPSAAWGSMTYAEARRTRVCVA